MKGPPQGPPPGLSCGNVGQMRSLHTIQYIWMYAHTCGCTPMDGMYIYMMGLHLHGQME